MSIDVCFVGGIARVRDTTRWVKITSDLKRWLVTVENADMADEFNEGANISAMEAERTGKGYHRNEPVTRAAIIEGRIETE